MWPLRSIESNADGDDDVSFELGEAELIRDCLQSFGPPPQIPKRAGAAPVVGDDGGVNPPEKWMADHANGAVCRLAGGWRAVPRTLPSPPQGVRA